MAFYLAFGRPPRIPKLTERFGIPYATPLRAEIARGALYRMLQNPIYRGLISDKGAIYSCQHAPIVDQDLWDRVQQALAQNCDERVSSRIKGSESVSLLTGMVFDAARARLTPTHSATRKRRYRYYTSRSLTTGTVGTSGATHRIPAQDLEQIVIDRLRHFLTDNVALHQVIHPIIPKPTTSIRL